MVVTFPWAPTHSATDAFGHLVHILKLLPTSSKSVLGCAGGAWAVISPWKQQLGMGHSRAGLAFAQHYLTLGLVALLAGFLPTYPDLGPLYRDGWCGGEASTALGSGQIAV